MLNKVMLIGNLGADPEVKKTKNDLSVTTLSVATSRRMKDKDGEYQLETEWHRVIAWGSVAEFCGNYLAKGHKIYVEGRLHTKKWTDKEGIERTTTEIISDTVQSLQSKNNERE